MSMCLHIDQACVAAHRSKQRGIGSSGTGVAGSCEPPSMGAGNQAWVLCGTAGTVNCWVLSLSRAPTILKVLLEHHGKYALPVILCNLLNYNSNWAVKKSYDSKCLKCLLFFKLCIHVFLFRSVYVCECSAREVSDPLGWSHLMCKLRPTRGPFLRVVHAIKTEPFFQPPKILP